MPSKGSHRYLHRLRSRVIDKMKLLRLYLRAIPGQRRHREDFEQIETFCMFIGYPRSGGSLVGSLIDAHPDAVIAQELNVLRCLRYGFTTRQVLSALLDKSRLVAQREGGRQHSGYSFAVPNQWQGRFRTLKVIGDKFADRAVEGILSQPRLFNRLRTEVGVPIKFIHVIRNPFDNITTIHRKHRKIGRTLDQAIEGYFALADGCARVRREQGKDHVFDFYLERLIADPHQHLAQVITWLGLQPHEDYLTSCASILFERPRKTQQEVEWKPEHIQRVRELMQRYDFLADAGYQPQQP
jgi:hypothetical protein